MTRKKILICGASGFIGRNLFEHFEKLGDHYEVFGTYFKNPFRISNPRLIPADLRDRDTALRATTNMDGVINAAALTAGSGALDPAEYIPSNNRINTNLVEAAYKNKVEQFVFLSCSILYPDRNPFPVRETDTDFARIHPQYRIWAYLKIFGEEMCRFYAGLGQTRFTVIRHSNIYGPHDKFDARGHVFAATIAKVMNGTKSEGVAVWGNGQEKRDFLHVSDLVRFVELALNYGNRHNRYEVFNVGSGRAVTVKELVEKINSLSGRNLPVHYEVSKPTLDTDIILDTAKAKKIFGWQPEVSLDKGIQETIEWYKKKFGGVAP